MEFVRPLFEIVNCIGGPVCRHVSYAKDLENNLKELKARAEELCVRRDDIVYQIDQVKQQKTPTGQCEKWLKDVNQVEEQLKIIEQEYSVHKRCFSGCCPDIVALMRLGKLVVEMIPDLKELQEKSKFESGFVTNLPPAIVQMMPVPALKAETSAYCTLQKLLTNIRDRGAQMIGIWGMGGVGKTTVMQLLHNTPEITSSFDIVIWVTVSKSCKLRNLQDQVAHRLSLNIVNNESDDLIARRLLQKLEGKKYLLLLDDVWEHVNLSKIGMPSTNYENGCKVVLTTREFGVCRDMGTDVEIKVEPLSEEEAWKMFHLKVGKVAILPTIQPLAKDIVRECGGLPLALNAVGGALRKEEDDKVWRNFLRELKSPATSYIKNMEDKVFKPLKVSYEHLKDVNTKNCFLYCGLYPEDHKIKKSELIDYWGAERLLLRGGTLAEARDKGHNILRDLRDASLFDRCDRDRYVKLHDVVRDLVLRMTSPNGEECRQVVRNRFSGEVKPEDKEWEDATRISFMHSELDSLPGMPNCPMLSILLLQWTALKEIPESFFNDMPSLRVLDLSYTQIRSLPTSISNLNNLRALLLRKCLELETLPQEVSALKELEVLRVTGTSLMAYLPSEIWELSHLKCVKFSSRQNGNDKKMRISSGTISRLSKLEELSIVELKSDLLSDESVEVLTKELGSLKGLSSLRLDFRGVNNLQHFIQSSKSWRDQSLTKFCFSVGRKYISSTDYSVNFKGYETCLRYEGGGQDSSIIPSIITEVLFRTESFVLEGHDTLEKLSLLGMGSMHGLKRCLIAHCCALETIVDEGANILEVDGAFPNLEYLELSYLWNLRSIWEGPSARQMQLRSSYPSLKDLNISVCPRLKKLFSKGMIHQFHNLESLCIESCSEFEEMLSAVDNQALESGALPKLKLLVLKSLPEFVNFFHGTSLSWSSLEEVQIYGCVYLEKLPFGVDSAPNLRVIKVDHDWWEALQWEDNAVKRRLDPLLYTPLLW